MSSKKDKFTNQDRFYMNLAINLAKGQDGLTGLNPSVGLESTTEVSPFLHIGQIIFLNFCRLEKKSKVKQLLF